MPLRVPRLGLPKWLALIIAAIVIMAFLFYWPPPYSRGAFTHRIGFCAEWHTDHWNVTCAPDHSPRPAAESNPNVRGQILYSGDNSRGWKMTLYQQATATTSIESHSPTLTDATARSTVEGLRAELAAAAEPIVKGAGLAIAIEPAIVDRTLWINLIHHVVVVSIIAGLWWILGKPGDDQL